MMMTIASSLMWVGAAEKPEQSKMTFKKYQNDSKQLTWCGWSVWLAKKIAVAI